MDKQPILMAIMAATLISTISTLITINKMTTNRTPNRYFVIFNII